MCFEYQPRNLRSRSRKERGDLVGAVDGNNFVSRGTEGHHARPWARAAFRSSNCHNETSTINDSVLPTLQNPDMAGASDKARFYLEQFIPELQDLQRKKIFSEVQYMKLRLPREI